MGFSHFPSRAIARRLSHHGPGFDPVRVRPQQEAIALYAEEAVVTASSVTRCGLYQDVGQHHAAAERGDHRDPSGVGGGKTGMSRVEGVGGGVGRGCVVASILRLGSARERGCDDSLSAVRVGELGGCGIRLCADSSGTVEAATR